MIITVSVRNPVSQRVPGCSKIENETEFETLILKFDGKFLLYKGLRILKPIMSDGIVRRQWMRGRAGATRETLLLIETSHETKYCLSLKMRAF